MRGGVAEVGGFCFRGRAGEDEEFREAGWEVVGHEPGVKLVDGMLNGVISGKYCLGMLCHDLLAESDAVEVVFVDLNQV